jgi:nicotinamide mononucleotide transporter
MVWAHTVFLSLYAVHWEWVALALAMVFLLLALAAQRLCWVFAALSTLVYLSIDWQQRATLSLCLNGLYLLIVLFGWLRWRRPGAAFGAAQLSRATHVYLIGGLLGLTLLSGFWAGFYSLATEPTVETFIVWSTLLCMVLLALKFVECWLYWLVTEAVSLVLYLHRGQEASASLHGIYMLLAIAGFWLWLTRIKASDRMYLEVGLQGSVRG